MAERIHLLPLNSSEAQHLARLLRAALGSYDSSVFKATLPQTELAKQKAEADELLKKLNNIK